MSLSPAPTQFAAVFGVRLDGVISFFSPGAAGLYGITADHAVGRPIHDIADFAVNADDLATHRDMALGDVWVFRHSVTTEAGLQLVLQTTCTVTLNALGTRETVVHSEVAGPRATADAVRPRPIHPIGGGLEVMTFANRSGVLTHVGLSRRSHLGLSTPEVIGDRQGRPIHPDDVALNDAAWRACLLEPEQSHRATVRVPAHGRGWVWIERNLTNRINDPAIGAVVISSREATTYRHSVEALDAAERTITSILQSSSEGVLVTDASQRSVFANARLAELLDIDPAELRLGRFGPSLEAKLPDLFGQLPPSGEAGSRRQFEFSIETLLGRRRWLRAALVPRYDARGSFQGSIVLVSDITQERAEERELELILGSGSPATRARLGPEGRAPAPQLAQSFSNAHIATLRTLSPREVEVVKRLMLGDRVPSIAAALFVSQSTVRNQLSAAFAKLGVTSQQELIHYVRERLTGQTNEAVTSIVRPDPVVSSARD